MSRKKIKCLAPRGRMEGKISRGRQRITFLDTIIEVPKLFACVRDRRAWKGAPSDAWYMDKTSRRRCHVTLHADNVNDCEPCRIRTQNPNVMISNGKASKPLKIFLDIVVHALYSTTIFFCSICRRIGRTSTHFSQI